MDGIARRSTPQLTLIGQPYRYLGYSNNKSTGSPVAINCSDAVGCSAQSQA